MDMVDMRPLEIEKIENNNIRCFNISNGGHNSLINLAELRAAFASLNMAFTVDEVKLLPENLDADHDGSISKLEYLSCLRPKCGKEGVVKAFDFFDSDKDGYLSITQACKAMSNLEVEISEEDTRELAFKRFSGGDGRIGFDLFYRMQSYAALFMHRSSIELKLAANNLGPTPVVVEAEKPATSMEIVVTLHVMFGAFLTSLLTIIPKEPSTITQNGNNMMMALYEDSKRATIVDMLTVVCLILWAGNYIMSLRMRGTPRGNSCPRFFPVSYRKIADSVSLSSAVVALSLLICRISPFIALLPILGACIFAFFLYCMRDW